MKEMRRWRLKLLLLPSPLLLRGKNTLDLGFSGKLKTKYSFINKKDALSGFSREVARFGNMCKDPYWNNLDRYFLRLDLDHVLADVQSKEEVEKTMQEIISPAQHSAVPECFKDFYSYAFQFCLTELSGHVEIKQLADPKEDDTSIRITEIALEMKLLVQIV
ncbi:hypothetical protein PIB30_003060 [Stylosanthes scabra]|uniref:Uncharacterized protein n=1 Tax=Stylosanthes scabra TaxID=79078 RepID=A0ABU6X168_9FABA|nr:hypothetical protein [Stylosanthes scabra]